MDPTIGNNANKGLLNAWKNYAKLVVLITTNIKLNEAKLYYRLKLISLNIREFVYVKLADN